MNFKLVFGLSFFGLLMAFATISLVPENIEPAFWLVIFLACAYLIAKNAPGKYFLHGLCTSLVNCVWITIAHVSFYASYVAHHPNAVKMGEQMNFLNDHPHRKMVAMAPLFGIGFGIVLGLFSFIASKVFKKKA